MRVSEQTELTVGAIVVLTGLAMILGVNLLVPAKQSTEKKGYTVTARFNRTDGISIGSEVRLSGVAVGDVAGLTLDEYFSPILTLAINDRIDLPEDTGASVETDGLFGSKYIELEPGGMEEMIPPGGAITYTEDSMLIDDLLKRIIGIAKSKQKKNNPQTNSAEKGTH